MQPAVAVCLQVSKTADPRDGDRQRAWEEKRARGFFPNPCGDNGTCGRGEHTEHRKYRWKVNRDVQREGFVLWRSGCPHTRAVHPGGCEDVIFAATAPENRPLPGVVVPAHCLGEWPVDASAVFTPETSRSTWSAAGTERHAQKLCAFLRVFH